MKFLAIVLSLVSVLALPGRAADNVFPPLNAIKADHPRLLIRSRATPLAISLEELRKTPRDRDVKATLDRLRATDDASSQAMVWLMTGEAAAAEKAVAKLRGYRMPAKVDTFHVYFRLRELALAYDWLHECPQFDKAARDEARANITPLAREGLRLGDDHIFHNYTWMSCGGVSLWALATAGEDPAADQVYEQIRRRFNERLFPALEYLNGLPSEPMGYWGHYVFTPAVMTLLAAQSASEIDLVSAVHQDHADWLNRNLETLIHGTLPDMRFIPWGDLQSGTHGGVTQEMAGALDAATWALNSPDGRWFDHWLAGKRGLGRFSADTAVFYLLYGRRLDADVLSPAAKTPSPTLPRDTGGGSQAAPSPATAPPLSYLAGGEQGGHFIARSGWSDGDTVVAFRCADYMGAHHHYDQGSFLIYRRGLLAVDPPIYQHVGEPQNLTEHHNALLIGGKPQRPAKGQSFTTLESFQKNLKAGKRLETGDITFWHDAGPWAAVAGQYAQAYDCPELASCVRQVLFIRPSRLIVVDQLQAKPGKQVPQVSWLLQLPGVPRVESDGTVLASSDKTWIRCQPLLPAGMKPTIDATPVKTQRATYAYAGGAEVILVHVLDVGDGAGPKEEMLAVTAKQVDRGVEVNAGGTSYLFEGSKTYRVSDNRK